MSEHITKFFEEMFKTPSDSLSYYLRDKKMVTMELELLSAKKRISGLSAKEAEDFEILKRRDDELSKKIEEKRKELK